MSAEDSIPEYMNVLGMVFSMMGLMMKVYTFIFFIYHYSIIKKLKACKPKSEKRIQKSQHVMLLHLLNYSKSQNLIILDPYYCLKNFKLKWCSWVALLCSCVSFANARSTDDTKQIVSSFMLSISAVVS
jgi:hypothetical protein